MTRLLLPAVLLALGTGCMSLDFMFLDAPKLDSYDFDDKLVPPELVEEVQFDRGDGTMLSGVWCRQDATLDSPPLIFLHGNGGNLETTFDRIAWYLSLIHI